MGGNQMVGFFICNEQRSFVEDILLLVIKRIQDKI